MQVSTTPANSLKLEKNGVRLPDLGHTPIITALIGFLWKSKLAAKDHRCSSKQHGVNHLSLLLHSPLPHAESSSGFSQHIAYVPGLSLRITPSCVYLPPGGKKQICAAEPSLLKKNAPIISPPFHIQWWRDFTRVERHYSAELVSSFLSGFL